MIYFIALFEDKHSLGGGGVEEIIFPISNYIELRLEQIFFRTRSNNCDRTQRFIEVDCKCTLIIAKYNKFKY
jgi:hypothetical protein